MRSLLRASALALVALAPASAYFHYLHYLTRSAPYILAPEKFDLAALPNKTVTFFVTDVGPSQYPQNDSFASVLSQIRQAAHTWNAVQSSDLRVAFGGLYSTATPLASTPGGQVVFEELPPGLLGYGGPTSCTYVTSGNNVSVPNASGCTNNVLSPNGTFFPISRAVIHLSSDLTKLSGTGPSYTQSFFLTAVHEMGHALGLQHTFTSSAMSTAATRATSLTRPIDADDVAGLSVLYPAANFTSLTGTIRGRVTANNAGVHMASVVAIRNGSGAVSALTAPDGTYRIDGVPPGQYYVYAHPLPPQSNPACLDICPPIDPSGQAVNPGGPFNTIFYGQTTNIVNASPVGVSAGNVADNINLAVQPRSDVPIYGVSIFSYTDANTVVSPGYLNMTAAGYGNVLAGGPGLAASGAITKGLTMQVMGGAASVYAVQPYINNGYTYLNVGISYSLAAITGPQHLIFTSGNFIYVLPSGLNLVQRKPPSVTSVTPNSDGSVALTATGLAADSTIYFDGLPTAIRTIDVASGTATIVPPPGASGQNATVSIYNHDGQNSLFLQSAAPAIFPYGSGAPPTIQLSPASLPAGSEAVVDITGINTKFTAGQTIVGFGSSDVLVRNVFVLSPTHLLADVSISPRAAPVYTEASVTAGFQMAVQPFGFSIVPAAISTPSTIPALVNAAPGQTGAYAGALVTINGTNLVSAAGGIPTVTVGTQSAAIASASPTQITFQIPANLAPGPVLLQVNNGSAASLPVAVSVDSAPSVITAVQNANNLAVDAGHPAAGGSVVRLLLSGFADPSAIIFPSQVNIVTGGISQPAVEVLPLAGGLYEVRFVVSGLVPSGPQLPITVYLDGRSSVDSSISIYNP